MTISSHNEVYVSKKKAMMLRIVPSGPAWKVSRKTCFPFYWKDITHLVHTGNGNRRFPRRFSSQTEAMRWIKDNIFIEVHVIQESRNQPIVHIFSGANSKNMDEQAIRQDMQTLEACLVSIENTLKVILCCALLPKNGPNWDYYERLFSSAEKMLINEQKGLEEMVRGILLKQQSMASQK